MKGIYKEQLIEHYKNPRNFRVMENATHKGESINESCGDEIYVYLKIKDGKVEDISFQGSGCAICIGTMSMLSEKIKNEKFIDLSRFDEDFVLSMIRMENDSPRKNCAIIAIKALKDIKSNVD